jgi:hypothetical protein
VKRAIAQAAALLTVCASVGFPQSKEASTEEVVRQFFKAEDDGRWLDAAHLLDLRRFESMRQATLKALRTIRGQWRRRTPEEMMQSDPQMPRAVAEYEANQANKGFEAFDLLAYEFARVPSADSLEALPIDEAAARWLEAKGPKWQEERDRKRASMRPPIKCPGSVDSLSAAAITRFKPPTAVILGTTAGDSIRYVVVGVSFGPRQNAGQMEFERPPNSLILVKVAGAWRIIPTHEMVSSTGFFGNMTVSIACEVKPMVKDSIRKN